MILFAKKSRRYAAGMWANCILWTISLLLSGCGRGKPDKPNAPGASSANIVIGFQSGIAILRPTEKAVDVSVTLECSTSEGEALLVPKYVSSWQLISRSESIRTIYLPKPLPDFAELERNGLRITSKKQLVSISGFGYMFAIMGADLTPGDELRFDLQYNYKGTTSNWVKCSIPIRGL